MAPAPNPGTPIPGRPYTVEQRAALDTMLDTAHELRTARAEFVNTALMPDGTLVRDLAPILVAARSRVSDLVTSSDMSPKALDEAAAAARKVSEIADHVAQSRFLFIIGADGTPAVYFQTATNGNPDVFDEHGAPLAPKLPEPAPVAEVAS